MYMDAMVMVEGFFWSKANECECAYAIVID